MCIIQDPQAFAAFVTVRLSSRRHHHLSSGRTGTTTAPGSTTGAATTTPLAEATTATVTAEVATSAALALLEVAALAVELLLLGTGAVGAALLDPELLVADLERAGGEGGLVALGGLEVDESAALCGKLVKCYRNSWFGASYLCAVDVEVVDLAELRKLLLHLRALDVLLDVLDVAARVAGLLLLLLLLAVDLARLLSVVVATNSGPLVARGGGGGRRLTLGSRCRGCGSGRLSGSSGGC